MCGNLDGLAVSLVGVCSDFPLFGAEPLLAAHVPHCSSLFIGQVLFELAVFVSSYCAVLAALAHQIVSFLCVTGENAC